MTAETADPPRADPGNDERPVDPGLAHLAETHSTESGFTRARGPGRRQQRTPDPLRSPCFLARRGPTRPEFPKLRPVAAHGIGDRACQRGARWLHHLATTHTPGTLHPVVGGAAFTSGGSDTMSDTKTRSRAGSAPANGHHPDTRRGRPGVPTAPRPKRARKAGA